MILTAIGVLASIIIIFVLLLAWSQERTKRTILEREKEQYEELHKINKHADAIYEERKKSVDNRLGDRINPDDPWSGVYESPTDSQTGLRDSNTPQQASKNE